MAPRTGQPFEDLFDLSRTLTRRLGEDFGSLSQQVAHIPLDMYETADEVMVQAYLPGFRHDQVKIELHENRLSIRGERPLPDHGEGTWIYVESPYGTVFRNVTVGPAIDGSKIEAAWQEGVLTIRLPKVEQARPRSIPIQVQDAQPALRE